MGKNIKLTYLFDAKYRIDNQLTNGVDTPPDDAINQMHRYRDAIYYKENCTNTLKKEVIVINNANRKKKKECQRRC